MLLDVSQELPKENVHVHTATTSRKPQTLPESGNVAVNLAREIERWLDIFKFQINRADMVPLTLRRQSVPLLG